MKKVVRTVMLITVMLFVPVFILHTTAAKVYGYDYSGSQAVPDDVINEQLNSLDFNEIDGVIRSSEASLGANAGFLDVILKVIKGELDLSPESMIKTLGGTLFAEVKGFLSLMKDMIIIAVLSAVFRAMSASLRTRNVSELAFYVNYIIAVTILLQSFMGAISIMRGFISELCRLIEAAVPLMTNLLLTSGNPASAYVFNPIIMFGINGAELLIRDIAAPVIIFAAVLEIVNNISEREMLGKFAQLIKKGLSIGLKALAGLFAGVLSIQRLSAPIVNNAAVRTAKAAVGVVPVVGQALTGAVDAVLYWSGAVKNGVMTAVIIFIILICLPVVLKLAAFVVVYKLTAGLIQPICDKRIVNAINAAGSLAAIVLGACTLAAVMFVFLMIIIISL